MIGDERGGQEVFLIHEMTGRVLELRGYFESRKWLRSDNGLSWNHRITKDSLESRAMLVKLFPSLNPNLKEK